MNKLSHQNRQPGWGRQSASPSRTSVLTTIGIGALLMATGIGVQLHTLFAAGPATAVDTNKPVLASCDGDSALFPTVPEDAFDKWKERYDDRVDGVIVAHLQKKNAVNCQQLVKEPPSDALKSLAGSLAPWKSNMSSLSEDDMGAVLLEYLRVYECSIKNHLTFDLPTIYGTTALPFTYQKERSIADRELLLAPRTLERTLQLISGMDRLRPIDDSLQCLARTSLDIRNTLGLAAETSACLPRIWDARGSLRSVKP